MPGVDDGAQTIEESCAALDAFAADGAQAIITTPHFDGSLTLDATAMAERLDELDLAWGLLSKHAREHHPQLRVERGVELMLDTPQPDVRDARLRLAGGPFVLLEFPFMTVPPRSPDVLAALRRADTWPILAHPERYHGFAPDLSLAEQWKRGGALLQVNGGSLLGRYGADARRFAHALIERGWADYIGSDYHARGTPGIPAYREALESAGAEEQAYLLLESNPRRVLEGQMPLPVPPIHVKRTFWGRVSELFSSR